MKYNLLVPALVLVTAATIGTGVATAQAHDGKGMFAKFSPPTAEMKAAMEKKMDERLSQLVTDGKITQQQKDLIAAKHRELASQRESQKADLESKTPAEHKELMEKKKAELEQWAKDNGIDIKLLMPGHGHGPGKGMRKMHQRTSATTK